MRDRDQIEALEIGTQWTVTRHRDHTEFKLGNKYDAGPKVVVVWDADGAAQFATVYDGDGEPMQSVEKGVMAWLAHELR